MVQAIISISDESNNVLNVIKAKYALKDKSAAIDLMAQQYEELVLEPELRPAYVKRAVKIGTEKPVRVGSAAALRARYA